MVYSTKDFKLGCIRFKLRKNLPFVKIYKIVDVNELTKRNEEFDLRTTTVYL